MAENRCATFYTWIYDSETVCRILLKKNPHIANMVFYLWIFFHSPVSITTLAKAKKIKKHGALWERARVPLFLVGTVFTQQTTLICYFLNCPSVEVHLLVNRLISVFCNISLTQEAHVRRIDVFFV